MKVRADIKWISRTGQCGTLVPSGLPGLGQERAMERNGETSRLGDGATCEHDGNRWRRLVAPMIVRP